jgi:hypothetical protein
MRHAFFDTSGGVNVFVNGKLLQAFTITHDNSDNRGSKHALTQLAVANRKRGEDALTLIVSVGAPSWIEVTL